MKDGMKWGEKNPNGNDPILACLGGKMMLLLDHIVVAHGKTESNESVTMWG
jgi:hypothetical protein